jgi:hypothetical protein
MLQSREAPAKQLQVQMRLVFRMTMASMTSTGTSVQCFEINCFCHRIKSTAGFFVFPNWWHEENQSHFPRLCSWFAPASACPIEHFSILHHPSRIQVSAMKRSTDFFGPEFACSKNMFDRKILTDFIIACVVLG